MEDKASREEKASSGGPEGKTKEVGKREQVLEIFDKTPGVPE
jgi:hypothetical protein